MRRNESVAHRPSNEVLALITPRSARAQMVTRRAHHCLGPAPCRGRPRVTARAPFV